jgi:hypothetical protein
LAGGCHDGRVAEVAAFIGRIAGGKYIIREGRRWGSRTGRRRWQGT